VAGSPIVPAASFATRTRPTTGEPNFEDGLQAAALEAELVDFRTAGIRWPTSEAVLGPRADIETVARELEARGRARATVTRRLCTIAGFCKYAMRSQLRHEAAEFPVALRVWP